MSEVLVYPLFLRVRISVFKKKTFSSSFFFVLGGGGIARCKYVSKWLLWPGIPTMMNYDSTNHAVWSSHPGTHLNELCPSGRLVDPLDPSVGVIVPNIITQLVRELLGYLFCLNACLPRRWSLCSTFAHNFTNCRIPPSVVLR